MGKITPRLFLKRVFVILILFGGIISYSFIDKPSAELLLDGANKAKNRKFPVASSSSFTGTITVVTKNITVQLDASGHLFISLAVALGSCFLASSLYATPVITVNSNTKVSCNGDTNGSISITITGITGTRSISWSGPNGYSSTAKDIVNLAAGNYTVTVTDNGDNSSSSKNIAVGTEVDNENPTITAPSDKTANTDDDGTGNCTTTVNLGSPDTNDNCGVQAIKAYVNGTEIDPSTYDFPIGTTTVKWEVTDNAGLKASDDQIVTVSDNEAPTFQRLQIKLQYR